MTTWADRRSLFLLAVALCALAAALLVAPLAAASTFTDVGSGHWARSAIDWVTDQGPYGDKVLDDYGSVFKPEQAITRAQLARALVILAGHEGETIQPRAIPDMPPDLHPYYWDVQLALHYGYLSLTTKNGVTGFYPDNPITAYGAEAAIVRWTRSANPTGDWSVLSALKSGWQPTAGWKPSLPSYFASVIASRALQLRFNHPSGADGQEVLPSQRIDRAEVAYMLRRASSAASSLWSLPKYASITLPLMSARQKAVLQYAFKFVGYPYVWAGEWPTKKSPYGYQASGGFDCSGFTFYVMQCHFGYPVSGRGAGDQARLAKPRITRAKLKPGDLIFFGYGGTKSTVSQIYHAALYMGNGWFIHSTGSSLWSLPKYAAVTLPPMSARQKAVLQYAFKFVGYPYVWAGEWPTKNSPYGYQASGGFDCSGFTFYVMQCHFGYPVSGRGAGDQARLAKPRITRANLKPGDLIFFGYDGTASTVSQIYHAALYMGNGWFIHSTGSSDGVTVARLNEQYNDYWAAHFAWGRRLLSPAELVIQ